LRSDFGCGLSDTASAAVSIEDVVGAEREADCGFGVSRKAVPTASL